MVGRFLFVYLDQESPGYAVLRDRQSQSIRRRPQLGFQYLASTLETIGVDSIILDQRITPFTVEDLSETVKSTSSDVVGFYTATVLKDKVKRYIAELRERIDVPVIVGGPGAVSAQEYLEAGCDIVCFGEGERTIIDIVNHYNGRKRKDEIKGISYMESGRFVKNEPRELIHDLDSLPFPNRDKIPIEFYHDYYIFTMRGPYVTMMASRGCPFSCTFCTSHLIWEGKYRVRSVENVLQEIDHVRDKFGVRYIAFLDDIFGLNDDWARTFCTGLIEKGYRDLRWMCILHPFSFRKSREELLDLCKESGCDTLSFGLQSAHPEILKNIKRNPKEPEELEKTVRMAKKKGFLTSIGFIFGLPGETKDTIRHTIDYCCKLRPTYAEFYNLDVLEGSEIEAVYKTKMKVCEMSKEELDKWCKFGARKFYLHPRQLSELVKIVITENPSWLLTALKNARHFIGTVGC